MRRRLSRALTGRSVLLIVLVPALATASGYVSYFAYHATATMERLQRRPILADTVDDARASIRQNRARDHRRRQRGLVHHRSRPARRAPRSLGHRVTARPSSAPRSCSTRTGRSSPTRAARPTRRGSASASCSFERILTDLELNRERSDATGTSTASMAAIPCSSRTPCVGGATSASTCACRSISTMSSPRCCPGSSRTSRASVCSASWTSTSTSSSAATCRRLASSSCASSSPRRCTRGGSSRSEAGRRHRGIGPARPPLAGPAPAAIAIATISFGILVLLYAISPRGAGWPAETDFVANVSA